MAEPTASRGRRRRRARGSEAGSAEAQAPREERPRLRVELDPPALHLGGAGLAFEIGGTGAPAAGEGPLLAGEMRGGTVSVARDGARFERVTLVFPGSRIALDGSVGGGAAGAGVRADLAIAADPLDLDDLRQRLLPAAGAPSGQTRRKGARRPRWPELTASLRARRVRLRGLALDELEGEVVVERDRYRIAPLWLRAGAAELTGAVDGPAFEARGATHLAGRIASPDTRPLLALLGLPGLVSGRLDATLDLVADDASFAKRLRGTFRLVLTAGRLHTIRVLAEVLSPLVPGVVTGVLGPFRRITEIEAFGTPFDRLVLDGEVGRGRVKLERAAFEAFGMTGDLRGSVALASGGLDLRGTLRVEANLLDRLGIERGGAPPGFTIPITVRGSLRAPRVLPDVAALAQLAGLVRLPSLPGSDLVGSVRRRLGAVAGWTGRGAAEPAPARERAARSSRPRRRPAGRPG